MGPDRQVRPPHDPSPSPAGSSVGDRTGLLIIRTWIERGSVEPLRAQIRLTTDVSSGFERTLTVLRVEAVQAAVQTWLDGIMRDAEA